MAGLWSFSDRYKILHTTWFVFFLTFVIWFNFAPLTTAIKADTRLTDPHMCTVAICNVALTVPAASLSESDRTPSPTRKARL
jgi:MFS transporter, NNP family, nitrate/nitrite transporter